MMTDASLANKSGAQLEETLELLLKKNDISYKRQTSGKSQIDFIINNSIYIGRILIIHFNVHT